MQKTSDGTVIVSATDLVGYLACDHLSTLELGRIEGRWERPPRRADPTVQLMQDRGDAHELAHLENLRAEGRSVVEIAKDDLTTPDRLRAAQADTLAAMRQGADVIFQATFFDGRWRGHADFLYRVERPSPVLGAYSYDIADTKLSRGVKAAAIIQMCVYADLLARLQGVLPETVYVVTGDGVERPHRLTDYAAYFRYARNRFEQRVLGGSLGLDTYPDPVEHCQVCVWYPTCIQRRRDDDHPSIVAGIRRVDTERFMSADVRTLTQIARLPPDASVPEVEPHARRRLSDQARLQLHERVTGERVYELIPPEPDASGRGLAALPEPTPWDVFFDIESDPWALDDGLEYLLGLAITVDGERTYLPFWSHDREEEKLAFESFIDLCIERLDAHPRMHVFHYGGYESGAVKRLMRRHATREDEVDRLLRGGVFVDLLNVVRQGVRASVESYSLKQIEKFYLAQREGPVTEAGFSVVEYERWMRERDDAILQAIADYNRDDCISTLELRDWLEERRAEAVRTFPVAAEWTRPPILDGLPTEAQEERSAAVQKRMDALTDGVGADRNLRSPEQQGRWLLAQLLDWHRRDDKPAWWLWHDLRQKSTEELIGASEGIGGLTFERELGPEKKSVLRRYRFPPQDHKFRIGSKPIDPDPRHGDFGADAGEILDIDDVEGYLDLKVGPKRQPFHPTALIPDQPLQARAMRDALLRIADAVIEHGMEGPGPFRAARELLLCWPPHVNGTPAGERLVRDGEATLDAARRIATALDETVLPIQGPPGTGKTYTGARMIVELVRAGKRVGIAAQSHKAISNLLREVVVAGREAGVPFRAMQRCDTGDEVTGNPSVTLSSNEQIFAALAEREVDVVAGTPWLIARAELVGTLDVLFVDEAGQMSLANVVAMSGAASSVVLLGDPNQLPMVSQGVHPEGAGESSLEHLLGSAVTLDDRCGLFLETTWRMHPAVNEYISAAFYEDRLGTHPSTQLQRITSAEPLLDGVGVRFVDCEHEGNASKSPQEAAVIAGLVDELIGSSWTDCHGVTAPIQAENIIIVAPYNAHVAEIARAVEARLGRGIRVPVGTVDKFQGQEGAIAIYSMASSSRDDAPRDMDFLYSRNRLNVAVSRARAVAIVIASPRLLEANCRTPEQMRLVNALCQLVEHARGGVA
ncbi:MAG TPA: TM0106 family RecB-like putative nuclease [Candidatus Binatia bacterium]|nr:TM0106 family RecB-like putative nuclease [Candidatus Binatia bacterium]